MTLQVLAVLTLATLVRSAFGFGDALIAMPLLALFMPVETAAPIVTLVSITVAALVLVQDRGEVHVRSAARLVLPGMLGIPLGLLLLTRGPEDLVKGLLACVIIAFSTHALISRRRPVLNDDRHAWMFGLGAGVLGGAYAMSGPPLVMYGAMRRWSPRHFRATLQGYFLPASAVVMGGYWLADLWTADVTRLYLLALPGVAVAVVAGRLINRRMDGGRFLVFVHLGLALIGAVLLAQAIAARG